jgi:inosose dehydratase
MKTRRQFLKVAGSGLLAAGVAPATGFSIMPVQTEKRKSTFSLGIAGYTFVKLDIERSIEIMKKAGVNSLSIKDFHMPLNSTQEQINAVINQFKSEGISVYGVGVIYMKTKDSVDQAFSYAKMAGVKTIICAPNYELLPYVEEKVRSTDFKLAIHNHGPDNPLYPNAADIWDHIKDLDQKIGICIDIGHTVRDGSDPAQDIIKYKSRIFDVHIKDVDKAAKDGKTVEMGRGIINIPSVIAALRTIKYTGSCSLEFEKDATDPLAGVCESVGYWKGVMACNNS